MQLIKINSLRRISRGSENILVEVISRLIDVVIPNNSESEEIRNECQSVASKNCKIKLKDRARIMDQIQATKKKKKTT